MPRSSQLSDEVIARALELARSGEFEFVYQIERRMTADGLVANDKTLGRSPSLKAQLRDVLKPFRQPRAAVFPRRRRRSALHRDSSKSPEPQHAVNI
jgi:hypothetical protein